MTEKPPGPPAESEETVSPSSISDEEVGVVIVFHAEPAPAVAEGDLLADARGDDEGAVEGVGGGRREACDAVDGATGEITSRKRGALDAAWDVVATGAFLEACVGEADVLTGYGLDVELEDDVTKRIDGARDGGTSRVAGEADGDGPLFDDGDLVPPLLAVGEAGDGQLGFADVDVLAAGLAEELDDDDLPDVDSEGEGVLPDGTGLWRTDAGEEP